MRLSSSCIWLVWIGVFIFTSTLHTPAVAGVGREEAGRAGFRIASLQYTSEKGKVKQRDIYIWYPTSDQPVRVGKGWKKGFVAVNGRVSPGRHPVLIFSHGYRSNGQQVLYLMEALARAGYVVISTDHADSFRRMLHERGSWLPMMFRPQLSKDVGVQSRREDILAMLDWLSKVNQRRGSVFHHHLDEECIGIIGYSLGGYTTLAMLGAVPEWKVDKFRCALLLAPFHPWCRDVMPEIDVPTMIQGGSWDIAITPKLGKLYRGLPAPSQLLVFPQATHFTWTNLTNSGKDTLSILEHKENPRLITAYSIAFFDEILKPSGKQKKDSAILRKPNPKLKRYHWK